MPIEKIVELFKRFNVLEYIEKGYGIFQCEGDETVLDDITEFLEEKKINKYLICPVLRFKWKMKSVTGYIVKNNKNRATYR